MAAAALTRRGAALTGRTTPRSARRARRRHASAVEPLDASLLEQTLGSLAFASSLATCGLSAYRAALDKPPTALETSLLGVASLGSAALLSARWIDSGHFPLSNLYESLVFLAWGATAVAGTVRLTGVSKGALPAFCASLASAACLAGATLGLPAELRASSALVPALKSNWLMMHVSVMMASYATLVVGSLLACAFLVLDDSNRGESATETAEEGGQGRGGEGRARGIVVAAATAAGYEVPLAGDGGAASTKSDSAMLSVAAELTAKAEARAEASSSPASVASSLAVDCDATASRCIGLGFVFLTVGIVSGAVWANEAWGAPWTWDPKESWALATWLTYASYLHVRLNAAGWTKRDANAVGAFGLLVTTACYLGVNLLGQGLHSYGFFA